MAETKNRKKLNFMINREIFVKIEKLIPPGKRSDFVNEALEKAIVRYGRKRASEAMDKLAKEANLSMTTEEFIKLKNYGRL